MFFFKLENMVKNDIDTVDIIKPTDYQEAMGVKYLTHRRPAKVQTRLRIRAVSSAHLLLACTKKWH